MTDEFEALSKSFTFVFWFCMSALQTACNTALDHPVIQGWALRALWAYSSVVVQLEEKLYNVAPWFSRKKPDAPWTSVCTLEKTFEFSEVVYHNTESVVENPTADLYDYVILTKADLPWISVRMSSSMPSPPEESAAHFLAITYHHPDLGKAISLDVPAEMLVVDNEILSPAFVRRALLPSTPFDDRYWIEFIDHQITFIKLVPSQYLLLTLDGYRVVDR